MVFLLAYQLNGLIRNTQTESKKTIETHATQNPDNGMKTNEEVRISKILFVS